MLGFFVGLVFFTTVAIIDWLHTNDPELQVCTYGDVNGTVPTLGIATANVKYGGTDDRILARVFYGDDDKDGQWSDWHNINNLGCDDRERGQVDFYDDFADISKRWLAVALYNCGDDGFALDAIFYWNGTHFLENYIDLFCGNVAGPMVKCYGTAFDPAVTDSYCFDSDREAKYYDYVFLDQNDGRCPGVLIGTGKTLKGNSSAPVGKLYPKADPGRPDCDAYTAYNSATHPMFEKHGHEPPVNDPDDNVFSKPAPTVTITLSLMNVSIAAVIILVCINVVMMVKRWCANKQVRSVKYAKVEFDDSASENAQIL